MEDLDDEEEDRGSRDLRKVVEDRSHGAGNHHEEDKEDTLKGSLEEEVVRGSDLRGIFDSPAKVSMSARDNA